MSHLYRMGLIGVLLTAGCEASPVAQSGPTVPAPATPKAPKYHLQATTSLPTYQLNLWNVSTGGVPSDWVNVKDLGFSYPWLVRGQWGVVQNSYGHRALEQSGMAWPWYHNSPPLSFMRFNSSAFGRWDKSLPDRYRSEVTMRVLACDPHDPYAPIGDSGVQVYFLNPTHYVEVIYRPKTFEVWQCNGGEPFAYTGWTLLGRYTNSAWTGQALAITADVDTIRHTLTVTRPGSSTPITFSVPFIYQRSHWMTLRASNAKIDFERVVVTQQ